MDKETFIEKLTEDIKSWFDDNGYDNIELHNVQKNKINVDYNGLVVKPEDENVGVTINLDKIYDMYLDEPDYDKALDYSLDTVLGGMNARPEVDIDTLLDYEQMKDRLVMEVVGIENNQEMLEKSPHKEMEDMAIIYRFVVDSYENGRSSVVVSNDLLDSMGVTPEQLHEDAMNNSPRIEPAIITPMSEVLAEMMEIPEEMASEVIEGMCGDGIDIMYIASVPDKVHGAGVIAYENFMDEAAERVGGSFFILPSSLHEVLLVPDNGNVGVAELQDVVREVNATQVAPEDKLTDNVYHYDAETKIFELGEKFEERQNQLESDISEKDADRFSVIGDLKAKKEDVAKQPKKDAVDKIKDKEKDTVSI